MGYKGMKGRMYACAHRGKGLCRLRLLISVEDTNLSDLQDIISMFLQGEMGKLHVGEMQMLNEEACREAVTLHTEKRIADFRWSALRS